MFRNSRPTPSPQTIELIRQLAYISGGALCGVTALYLEECRRRLQVVQRVLDKRRAIVQASQTRRYSRVALAARSDDVGGEDVFAFGYRPPSFDDRHEAKSTRSSTAPDSAQSRPKHRLREQNYGSRVSGVNIEKSDANVTSGNGGTAYDPRDLLYSPAYSRESNADYKDRPSAFSDEPSNPTREQTSAPSPSDLFELPRPRRHRAMPARAMTRAEPASVATRRSETERVSPRIARGSRSSTIDSRITALLQQHNTSDGITKEAITAYLPHALQNGTLESVSKLCHWMLDNGVFTSRHSKQLLDWVTGPKTSRNTDDLVNFYAKFLSDPGFDVLGLENAFAQRVRFLTHALEWKRSAKLSMSLRGLCTLIFTNSDGQRDIRNEMSALESECNRLLSAMDFDRASQLFVLVSAYAWTRDSLVQSTAMLPLYSRIWERVGESEHLRASSRMLLWLSRHQSLDAANAQLNTFVALCGRKKAYDVLAQFIRMVKPRWPITELMHSVTGVNKANLSIAIATSPRLGMSFDAAYRMVPHEYQRSVNETAGVETLHARWRSTRNLDLVEGEALRVSSWLKEKGDEKALIKVDAALLEIYLSSGKYDRALKYVSRIQEHGQMDAHVMALVAQYFANRWEWDGLQHLLDATKHQTPFTFDARSTALFNEVVRLYSQAHSPLQTWMFISTAIEELRFQPNFATVAIVLRKLIYDKALDLIPRWLRFLSAVDASFNLSSQSAALVVHYYYLETRQPSDYMYRLCYRLTKRVHWFTARPFKRTLRIAIAHDSQYGRGGTDALAVVEDTRARLQLLSAPLDILPDPDSKHRQARGPFERTQHAAQRSAAHTSILGGSRNEILDEAADNRTKSEEKYYETVDSFYGEARTSGLGGNGKDNTQGATSPEINDGVAKAACEQEFCEVSEDAEDVSSRISLAFEGQADNVTEKKQLQRTEESMASALARHQYREALDIYHNSCDATGLPASMYTLKHAVDASIRLNDGATSQAEQLLINAKSLGMDVHRATEPMLIHQSGALAFGDTHEAKRLCSATVQYYAGNHQDGYRVKFALAHKVADTLIKQGHADQALRLLSSIFQSQYIKRMRPKIQTMAIWIKAYAQFLSMDGIRWAVDRVLSENFSINRIFLHDLEKIISLPFKHGQRRELRSLLKRCVDKRTQQDLEAKVFGSQLVYCLAEYSLKYSNRTPPSRASSSKAGRSQSLAAGNNVYPTIRRVQSAEKPFRNQFDSGNAETPYAHLDSSRSVEQQSFLPSVMPHQKAVPTELNDTKDHKVNTDYQPFPDWADAHKQDR